MTHQNTVHPYPSPVFKCSNILHLIQQQQNTTSFIVMIPTVPIPVTR